MNNGDPHQEEDFRPQEDFSPTENPYPYSSYYDSNAYACEEAPVRRKRRHTGLWAFVLILILIAVGCVVFAQNYNVSVLSNDNGWAFSISKKGAQAAIPDQITPVTQIAEEEDVALPSFAPTGDGTVLPISTLDLSREPLTLQQVYSVVEPSVVGVKCQKAHATSGGTGIIMSDDGYIITNCHVISDAVAITVELSDGTEYAAALVGSDDPSDLAVIKIDAAGLPAAEFGSSDSLQVGDEVSAIGNPLGLQLKGTLTNGIISAINRDIEVNGRTMTLIQTNAALNAGNSGGPLINGYGQVVGINTMKISSLYTAVEGLGFAIPISLAKPIVDELIEKGYVSGRPAIGITGRDVTVKAAAYYRIPGGVLVNTVEPGSDAEEKGLAPGDVIVQVNGVEVSSMEELNSVKNQYVAGESVTLTIYRSGQLSDIDVKLMDAATLD